MPAYLTHAIMADEFLKRENTIDDGMYNFCINKLLKNLELEKSKINDDYIKNIDNYRILT